MTPDRRYAYPVRHGIPVFLRYPQAEDPSLDALLALAARVGCVEALRQMYGAGSEMFHYVTRRPTHLDLVPLKSTDRVLTIGPGYGQFTSPTAARVASVDAFEVVEQQARFTRMRCAEAGATNVRVACGGDDCRLPYPDETFDVVIANLVFEWSGSRNPAEPQQVSQARLLTESARVLKPGGVLYLSTKNRYALHYLLGQRDEHAALLRFGNALPRPLLRTALRLAQRRRASQQSQWGLGLLYSHRGLRPLVERSGFRRVTMYCPIPDPRYPEQFVEARAGAIRQVQQAPAPVARGRFVGPIMRTVPPALFTYLTYGQALLAYKEPQPGHHAEWR